ncbi:MAG: NfeD family protein [Candidatus Bathyarchaeia archaeon]|jgi:membrane protein implicated in regulation of membrane protease activity
MHISLALVIGLLVAVGAFLVYVALVGVSFIGLGVSGEVELATTLFVAAAIIILIFAAGFRAQFRRVRTGREALIGATGTVTTTLNPRGEVRVMSEFWEAEAKEGTIAAGQTVEVIGMDGLTLVVKPCEQKA